jgi:toxin-antitoxin system PIN domain toxin
VKVIDLNVWLYAINSDSAHHLLARKTLQPILSGSEPVGMPWVVLLGFLRISTNPRVLPNPLSPDQAAEVVDGWLALPVVELLNPGREHWPILQDLIRETGTAANLVTDTHLAALAIENGATLVSFDTDFSRFRRLKFFHPST